MTHCLLLILQISFAHAAGPILPWPGQNPGYTGPAPAAAPPQQIFAAPPLPPQPAPAAAQANPINPMQLLNALMSAQKSGKQDLSAGDDLRNGYSSKYGQMNQVPTDGRMEPCSTPPAQVTQALEEAKEFRDACEPAQRGEGQRVVINDYSLEQGTPYMYIFDLSGKCLGKTAVSYGNGLGPVSPEACSDPNCHLTPPGFHLTAYHSSDSYPSDKSLSMVSLEGQGSQARGILIHPTASPGMARTWGCAGVGSFDAVKKTLGEGALVYNFFGNKGKAGGCKSSAGLEHNGKSCRLESAQRPIPAEATGQGTPATK